MSSGFSFRGLYGLVKLTFFAGFCVIFLWIAISSQFAAKPAPTGTPVAVPSLFAGTWTGKMNQPDSPQSPYPMDVDLYAKTTSDGRVADVEYRTLHCRTVWFLRRAEAKRLVIAERVVSGRCVDGFMEVKATAGGRLSAEFHYNSDLSDEAAARVSLTRSS